MNQETTMDYEITDGAREYKAGLPAGDALDVYAAMMRTFEDFKSENDDRLKAIEKRGGDVIAEEKVARIDAALNAHQKRLDELSLKGAPTPQSRPDPAAAEEPVKAPVAPSLALRLEQAVEKELSKVESLRHETGSALRRSIEAERIARTLAALTQTLFKVRRLREPGNAIADDHDDLPADADEFRRSLARRIDAFVRSRTDGSVSEADEPPGAASPAP